MDPPRSRYTPGTGSTSYLQFCSFLFLYPSLRGVPTQLSLGQRHLWIRPGGAGLSSCHNSLLDPVERPESLSQFSQPMFYLSKPGTAACWECGMLGWLTEIAHPGQVSWIAERPQNSVSWCVCPTADSREFTRQCRETEGHWLKCKLAKAAAPDLSPGPDGSVAIWVGASSFIFVFPHVKRGLIVNTLMHSQPNVMRCQRAICEAWLVFVTCCRCCRQASIFYNGYKLFGTLAPGDLTLFSDL